MYCVIAKAPTGNECFKGSWSFLSSTDSIGAENPNKLIQTPFWLQFKSSL